jgi:hypothetical protein
LIESNALLKHYKHLLILHPEWRLPDILLSLNANPQLTVSDKIHESNRILPKLDYSIISQVLCSLCLDTVRLKQSIPKPSDPLDGIISDLTKVCGGNVHDRDVVLVTSSKCDSDPPKVIADLKSDVRFCSSYREKQEDIPFTRNNWISYDFKHRRIIPTHYSIRSPHRGHGPGFGNYVKSWLVEVSTDGDHWVEIDRRENNSELAKQYAIVTFEVSGNEICRYIRLVNIGRNHQGYDCLCICGFEIFGSLIESVE